MTSVTYSRPIFPTLFTPDDEPLPLPQSVPRLSRQEYARQFRKCDVSKSGRLPLFLISFVAVLVVYIGVSQR